MVKKESKYEEMIRCAEMHASDFVDQNTVVIRASEIKGILECFRDELNKDGMSIAYSISKTRDEDLINQGYREAVRTINNKWLSLDLYNGSPLITKIGALDGFGVFMQTLSNKYKE